MFTPNVLLLSHYVAYTQHTTFVEQNFSKWSILGSYTTYDNESECFVTAQVFRTREKIGTRKSRSQWTSG